MRPFANWPYSLSPIHHPKTKAQSKQTSSLCMPPSLLPPYKVSPTFWPLLQSRASIPVSSVTKHSPTTLVLGSHFYEFCRPSCPRNWFGTLREIRMFWKSFGLWNTILLAASTTSYETSSKLLNLFPHL